MADPSELAEALRPRRVNSMLIFSPPAPTAVKIMLLLRRRHLSIGRGRKEEDAGDGRMTGPENVSSFQGRNFVSKVDVDALYSLIYSRAVVQKTLCAWDRNNRLASMSACQIAHKTVV